MQKKYYCLSLILLLHSSRSYGWLPEKNIWLSQAYFFNPSVNIKQLTSNKDKIRTTIAQIHKEICQINIRPSLETEQKKILIKNNQKRMNDLESLLAQIPETYDSNFIINYFEHRLNKKSSFGLTYLTKSSIRIDQTHLSYSDFAIFYKRQIYTFRNKAIFVAPKILFDDKQRVAGEIRFLITNFSKNNKRKKYNTFSDVQISMQFDNNPRYSIDITYGRKWENGLVLTTQNSLLFDKNNPLKLYRTVFKNQISLGKEFNKIGGSLQVGYFIYSSKNAPIASGYFCALGLKF